MFLTGVLIPRHHPQRLIDRQPGENDMRNRNRMRSICVAATTAAMCLASAASAWYGGPWYRPYGSGAMTYERQNTMRHHAWAMDDLAAMLSGRRTFDRAEAVRLAHELEAGFGPELLRDYAPGTWVAGSRTAPWTWDRFARFDAYAKSAKQSADRLAQALAQTVSADDAQAGNLWLAPDLMRRRGMLGRHPEVLVSADAMREYDRLNAMCRSCHALFRLPRW
jgi:cytochrome c556